MPRVNANLAVLMALAVAIVPAYAHVCMWEPMQRGTVDISGPAENPCYQKVGPCGVNTPGTSFTSLPAGGSYTVRFQQNANHYYTGKPGALIVDWAQGSSPSESDFTTLAWIRDYNAMGELTQTNFTRTIDVPDMECDACVLRVRYMSNNPDEDPEGHGPTFYQCADVKFVSSSDTPAATTPSTPAMPANQDSNNDYPNACCAPSSFTTSFQMVKPMTTSKGTIYYDMGAKMMREDVVHGAGTGTTASNGQFTIISNFTSGDGYYFNVNTGKCMLGGAFGLDLWNSWCFGSSDESEKFAYSAPCQQQGSGSCNYYMNEDWAFSATADSQCFPDSIIGAQNSGNAATVTYSGAKAGPINPDMWDVPAACKAAEAMAHGDRRVQEATRVHPSAFPLLEQ